MCTSQFRFFFFADDILLAVNFIFILDYTNDVRQKANSSDSLIQVQIGHEAGHGDNSQQKQCIWPRKNTNTHTEQWWFKKFCKGDESLGDEEYSRCPSEVNKDQLGAMIKADPVTTTSSVQFSSVAQSCQTLCNPMKSSMPGLPVHHHLPEFTQIHVHRVSDAIQPSHPLSSPTPPAPNPSQHQGLYQ